MTDPASLLSPLDDPPDAPLETLRRREDAWRSTHRVDALWPGLDGTVIQSAANAIGAAVAGVLGGERATLECAAVGPDAERRARAAGVAALLTGVGPLLGAWIARGELEAEPALARVLARHLAHARAREARIRSALIPVLARMERAGLEPGLIKGLHTAHAYFPEPGARPFADVDVVVPPAAIAQAERLLGEAGFEGEIRIDMPTYKREWLPPDGPGDIWSYELWHARSKWKLDLHDGLNFLAVVQNERTPQVPRFAQRFTLDGVTLRVADPNELIALLAAHASTELYSQRLLRLVELVLVVRRATALGTLDWRAVESSLAERGSLRFAYPMLALTERLAPDTVDAALLSRLSNATTARARAVTSTLSPTAPVLDASFSLRERLMWASGLRATMRWMWRMIAPLEGASRSRQLRTYRHRAMRLLTLGRSGRSRSDVPRDG
jgi:Uncharacterised nucleotidyltransferase